MILKPSINPSLGTLTVVLKCSDNKEVTELRKHFASGDCEVVKATLDNQTGIVAIALRPPTQIEAEETDNEGGLTVEGEEPEEDAEHPLGSGIPDAPKPAKVAPKRDTGNQKLPAAGDGASVQKAAKGGIVTQWSKQ